MRAFRHIRSNAIAYVALFFALGGTAYAATSFVEAPPNGGTGGTDASNVAFQATPFRSLIQVPRLGRLYAVCDSQLTLGVANDVAGKLDVFDNVDGAAERMTVAPENAPFVASVNEGTRMGQIQLSTFPGGATRAATIQVAIQESGGKCRVLAQSIHVVKPAE